VHVHGADSIAEAIGFGGQSRETIQRLMPEAGHLPHLLRAKRHYAS
jgi:hypothetical protein